MSNSKSGVWVHCIKETSGERIITIINIIIVLLTCGTIHRSSLAQQMELVMSRSMQQSLGLPSADGDTLPTADEVQKTLLAAVRTEMAVLESTDKRGLLLRQFYGYLPSIPPTSIEAERAFSSAGIMCTKIRSHA